LQQKDTRLRALLAAELNLPPHRQYDGRQGQTHHNQPQQKEE
jgi:hypothetical protein